MNTYVSLLNCDPAIATCPPGHQGAEGDLVQTQGEYPPGDSATGPARIHVQVWRVHNAVFKAGSGDRGMRRKCHPPVSRVRGVAGPEVRRRCTNLNGVDAAGLSQHGPRKYSYITIHLNSWDASIAKRRACRAATTTERLVARPALSVHHPTLK